MKIGVFHKEREREEIRDHWFDDTHTSVAVPYD